MKPIAMGCDPHLDTFTAAVIDESGRPIDQRRCSNTPTGYAEAARMCRRHHLVTVGIEGASGHGRPLAAYLVQHGIEVIEVTSRVTAAGRDRAGKTDPGDAVVVARATAADRGHTWRHDPALEALRVLVHRRDSLVKAQTGDINQLRALLAEIDPDRAARMRRLRSKTVLTQLGRVRYGGNPHRVTIAAVIRQIARTCLDRRHHIHQLTTHITDLLPPSGHRLVEHIHGCGVITAATLIAELAGTAGFATAARFASWTGTAPIPVSSGRTDRHRLNRGGNRQANRALHTIIITQLQTSGEAAHYTHRRITEGKTRKEAIRAAKRHLARRIWKLLNTNNLT